MIFVIGSTLSSTLTLDVVQQESHDPLKRKPKNVDGRYCYEPRPGTAAVFKSTSFSWFNHAVFVPRSLRAKVARFAPPHIKTPKSVRQHRRRARSPSGVATAGTTPLLAAQPWSSFKTSKRPYSAANSDPEAAPYKGSHNIRIKMFPQPHSQPTVRLSF